MIVCTEFSLVNENCRMIWSAATENASVDSLMQELLLLGDIGAGLQVSATCCCRNWCSQFTATALSTRGVVRRPEVILRRLSEFSS